jgi:Capsid protein VP4
MKPPKEHPNKRPNWGRLNEGQRRYAVEQYNLSLVRRGIPIDHPNPREYTLTPFANTEAEATPSASPQNIAGPSTAPREAEEEEAEVAFEWLEDQDPEYQALLGELEAAAIEAMVHPGSAMEAAGGGTKRKQNEAPHGGKRAPGNEPDIAVAGTSGGHADGGGVGGGSESGGGYVVPISRMSNTHHFRRYCKTHKMLTYGVAPVNLKRVTTGPPVSQVFFLTTSLAEIPVHKLNLYMTPAEFSLLRPGETVRSIEVRIIQRNVRVAFETAATSTGLATLNQNKNGVVAMGLNLNPWYIRGQYTFGASTPMIPTQVLSPNDGWNTDVLYGVNDAGTTSDTVGLPPASLLGFPFTANNYAVISQRENVSNTNIAPSRGWPNVTQHVKQFDAADFVGQEVAKYNYVPKMGMIARPDPFNFYGNQDQTATFELSGHYEGRNSLEPISTGYTFDVGQNFGMPVPAASFIYQADIEKSAHLTHLRSGSVPHLQPSLHVGVMPVPQLTTNIATNTAITTWTDVQSYFDIECEMVTEFHIESLYSGDMGVIQYKELEYPVTAGAAPQYNASRMGLLGSTNPIYSV